MHRKLVTIARTLQVHRLPSVVDYLLRDEAISGKLIIAATLLALLCANTTLSHLYEQVWHTKLSIGLGQLQLQYDLRHWINEGLMTFFFLVVGLEIKRETVRGELTNIRTALLPIGAAVGGMVVPALIYMSLNLGSDGFGGWAIPTATDIAFAAGILALLGRRVPTSLKLFLLTLAIVDDIGAIAVIAIFYGTGFSPVLFGLAVVTAGVLFGLRRSKLLTLPLFVLLGVALWLCLNGAGIHATIAGAILGFLAPLDTPHPVKPIAERIERAMIPISTLIVVPLFAFANTGVALQFSGYSQSAVRIALGVGLGLIVGKVIGITLATWLLVRFTRLHLPHNSSWTQIIGVGMLAGIGFTVSIFVTELAFASGTEFVTAAKLSIFAASTVSGVIGLLILRRNQTIAKQ